MQEAAINNAIQSLPIFPQLVLPMFEEHEIAAWQVEEARRMMLREKRKLARDKLSKIRVIPHKDASGFLWTLEELDLSDRLVGNREHELDTESCPTQAVFEEPSDDLDASPEEWSQVAVEELHETVLHYSLNVLQARGNSEEKKEVLQWIFAPETYVMPACGANGQVVEVYLPQQVTPFSFEQCCRICGYNSERLMNELEPILRKLKLQRL